MRESRKIGKIIVLLLVCVFLLFSVAGCAPKMREDGYFTYYIRKGNDGIKYAHISELTELGKQQKILVIPEEIGGKKVIALDKWKFDMWSPGLVWESENLEKVIFTTDSIKVENGTFRKCFNLEKFILTIYENDNPASGIRNRASSEHYLYISKRAFEQYLLRLVENKIISEEEARNATYSFRTTRAANLSYYYNYEIYTNDGYYWIDDVDYGEKIEYIPSNPVREGYEFGGWYKETECINEWIFETDTLPQEQFENVEVEATPYEKAKIEKRTIYQETKLYAKWVIKQ